MTHTSKNWQVIYRHKDSLAGCFVWAPDEAQAEKKFKARKEFEYDPEFDRDPEEGTSDRSTSMWLLSLRPAGARWMSWRRS